MPRPEPPPEPLRKPDGSEWTDAEIIRLLRAQVLGLREHVRRAEEESRTYRATTSLLLRAFVPGECATLSLDVLDRIRAEGLALDVVVDKRRNEILVRIMDPVAEGVPPEAGGQSTSPPPSSS